MLNGRVLHLVTYLEKSYEGTLVDQSSVLALG